MPVRFDEIVFRNANNIDVELTIETPIGKVLVQSHPVAKDSTYMVQPGRNDCASVLFEVRDSSHPTLVRQTFEVAPPGHGQSAYLTRVDTRHQVGSIRGKFVARTEGMD
jgi:hypothetical protein